MLTNMRSENCFDGFDSVIAGIVRGKARDLAKRPEFATHEVEDLEQEFITTVIAGLSRYDAARAALKTYVRRLVDRRAARLIDHRLAEKRAGEVTASSLDVMMALNEEEVPAVPGDDPVVDVCRRLDTEAVLDCLSEAERDICRRLRTHSITEVSTVTGIPRGTLYDILRRIRKVFAEAGMEDYLA